MGMLCDIFYIGMLSDSFHMGMLLGWFSLQYAVGFLFMSCVVLMNELDIYSMLLFLSWFMGVVKHLLIMLLLLLPWFI